MKGLAACAAALCATALTACGGVPLRDIRVAEDLRVHDSAPLKAAARSWLPAKRRAAARAMGRIQSPAYADALTAMLDGRGAQTREEAAFALGQLGLSSGWEGPGSPEDRKLQERLAAVLGPKARSGPLGLRLAAAEALGKTGPSAETPLRALLRDPEPELRAEAALGLFRLRYLKRIPAYSSDTTRALIAAISDPVADARWKAIYAFTRFPEPKAELLLSQALDGDTEMWAKFFAARALGQLKEEAPWEELVRAGLRNYEPLIRAEAVKALGAAKRAGFFPDTIYRDASPRVRAAAADALVETGDRKLAYRLDEFAEEPSVLVQGQLMLAEAALRPGRAASVLALGRAAPHWWVRSRAYLATASLAEAARAEAVKALIAGLKDPDPRVAAAAVEGLSKASPEVFERFARGALPAEDLPVEVFGAVVEGAARMKGPALIPALAAAFDSPTARRYPELLDDIRNAHRQLVSVSSASVSGMLPQVASRPGKPSPWVGRGLGATRVVLETQRGEVELELAVREAPVHSAAFADSVRKGLYDGLAWHRVVSGFVVQGGDPRGSGWGDAGFTLRDEINRLRFGRGALGMPKAGKDTGGCQLFISVVPAPHLDGRYTVFGRVLKGMEAVDALEPGDKIIRARLAPSRR